MSEAIQEERHVCRPPTPAEAELFEWSQETRRKTPGVVAKALRRLVTLDVALLGGTAALYEHMPMPPAFKAIFFILALGSLGVALWGSQPLTSKVLYLEDAGAARERSVRVRSAFLWWASLFLFVGFAFLAGGMLAVLFGAAPKTGP